MGKVYEYEFGKLIGKYRDIVEFDLEIRKPITQVYGKSATGKSLLVDYIRTEKKNKKFNNEGDDVSNIFVFDEDNVDLLTVSSLSKINKSLIIVDRCDLILEPDIVNYIVSDESNHYLLFSRTAFSLGLSPNYYGEFKNDNKVVSIFYEFNEKGWF